MAQLSAAARKKLPQSAFALPGRQYPIHDRQHAEAAVKMAMAHLSGEKRAKVLNAVARRYPDLKEKFKDLPGGDDSKDNSSSRRRTALKAVKRKKGS